MTEEEKKQIERQNAEALERLKQQQAAMREEQLRIWRLEQAKAIDMQRALDKDRRQRAEEEIAQNLGRLSDAQFAEYCRKFGFNP